MAQPTATRFHQLDGLRGLAALCVALFHFTIWHPLAVSPLVQNAYLMVDFFFVLSGFVLAHSYGAKLRTDGDFMAFLVRRFGRLWPLHMLTLLMLAMLEGVKWYLTTYHGLASQRPAFTEAMAPIAFLAHTAFLNAHGLFGTLTWNSPSWSIGAEFYTYILFAVLVLLVPRPLRTALLLALPAWLALYLLAPHGMDSTYDFGLVRCIAGFFLGVVAYGLYTRLSALKPRTWLARHADVLVLAIVLLFLFTAGVGVTPFLAPGLFMVMVLTLAAFPGPFARVLQSRPLQHLGAWSYGIYLIHTVVLFVMGWGLSVLKKLLPLPIEITLATTLGTSKTFTSFGWVYDSVLLGAYLISVVVAAAILYRWFELPCQRWFNQRARAWFGKA